MADDDLGLGGGATGGEGNDAGVKPNGGGGGAAASGAATSGGVDREAVADLLKTELGPVFNEIATALKTLHEGQQQRSDGRGEPPAGGGASGGDADSEAVVQKFLSDPEGFIKEVAKAGTSEAVGPLFQTLTAANVKSHIREQRERIDDEFGEGAWDEHFDKQVQEIISTWPPQFRASEEGIAGAVSQVLGQKYKELKPKAEEHSKVKAKRDFQVLPPGRVAQPRSKLNADEELYLEKLEEFGTPMKREDYLKAKATGNKLSDYLKAKGKENFLDGSS